jgi:plastocyanin
MYRDTFCPQRVTVKRNTRLRWVNVDKRTSHSVWFKDAGRAESDRAFPEDVVEMIIDWPPGEYPYLCGPHWEREGMVGRLTVIGD